jgi:undecaprenyl-diphosphatase
MSAPLLPRLDAHDRSLMLRCAMAATAPRHHRLVWTAITHLGSTPATLLAIVLPWLLGGMLRDPAQTALAVLASSHVGVQIMKRTVVRSRPSVHGDHAALVAEPDRFSFPSGHAAAAMSLALVYGLTFPALLLPLLAMAILVGFSRVRLAVHYPGDVLFGQLLAAAATLGVLALR